MKAAGTVILPVDATYEGATAEGQRPLPMTEWVLDSALTLERSVVFAPFGPLADAAAALGHNLTVFDADGPVRHTVPFVRNGASFIPSLGLAAALRAARIPSTEVRIHGHTLRIADRSVPLALRRTRNADRSETYQWNLVNFRGPAFLDDLTTRPYTSFRAFDLIRAENDILNGQKPEIDPSVFKDKLVFVGATATALFDAFETPFSQGRMPGMQVHASVADDVLSNRFMTPGGSGPRIAVVFALALAVGAIATALPAWWATAASAAVLALFVWLATRLFAGGYWMNLTQPVFASSIALFGGVAYQYFVEGREKRKMKRLFGRYVSKDVYEQLVANPELAQAGWSAAGDDRAVLGYPGLHHRDRARAAGRNRRHAERVLHEDGRDRLPSPGDGGQVRRRHGDGALRRAARRPASTRTTRSRPRST